MWALCRITALRHYAEEDLMRLTLFHRRLFRLSFMIFVDETLDIFANCGCAAPVVSNDQTHRQQLLSNANAAFPLEVRHPELDTMEGVNTHH